MCLLKRIAGFLVVLTGLIIPADAAPKAALWDIWAARSGMRYDRGSPVWDRLLQHYVRPGRDGINRLAYDTVTASDREALDGYINALAEVPVRALSQTEQLPFWVNLYNALTVRVVLEHYPVDSIRDIAISPGFFAQGPWGKKLITVEGVALSLDDIEHRILRPIWRDPRIHYAVNCASVSCRTCKLAHVGGRRGRLS